MYVNSKIGDPVGEDDEIEENVAPVEPKPARIKKDKKNIDSKLASLEASIEDNIHRNSNDEKNQRIRNAFVNVWEDDEKKSVAVLGLPRKPICLATVILFALDMLLINTASYKVVYMLMEKLLRSNGVEALRLSDAAFSRIFVGVSYVASFLLGGVAVLITAKLAEYIIKGLDFKNGRTLTLGITAVFGIIFLIGAAIAALVTGEVLSLEVYRWAGPLMTYVGGIMFLVISSLHVNIDS